MTTGSQSVIGTKTITKITNASGQSVQATGASGCSPSSSVCEIPAGTYSVGKNFTGPLGGTSGGPLTQVGLIDGPTNGQCSTDLTITIDTNAWEAGGTTAPGVTSDSASPYVLYITAVWPAS
jgi:hypothetical protein